MKNIITLLILLFSTTAFAEDRTIVNPRDDQDTVIKTQSGGVQTDVLRANASATRVEANNITAIGGGPVNFPNGVTGVSASITDLTISSIADPTATIAGGSIKLSDGRELRSYDGAGTVEADFGGNLAVDLDAAAGGAPADGTYFIYVDLAGIGTEITLTDSGRKLTPLTAVNFAALTTSPSETNQTRYVALGSAIVTGSAWSASGFTNTPTKIATRAEVTTSPIVYTLPQQSVGTVGAVDNAQGPLVDGDFPTPANTAYYHLGDTGADGQQGSTLVVDGTVTFDSKGFFNRETVAKFGGSSLEEPSTAFFDITGDITFGGWANLDKWHNSASNQVLWGKWEISGNQRSYFLQVVSSNDLRCAISSDGAFNSGETVETSTVGLSGWHHIVCNFDDSTDTMRQYLDGQLIGTTVLGAVSINSGTGQFAIGAGQTSGAPINTTNGSIQDVFVTTDVLTPSQVNSIYSKRFQGRQIARGHVLTADSFPLSDLTGKVAFWPLSDTGDDSVNGLNFVADDGVTVFTGSGLFGDADSAVFDDTNSMLVTSTEDPNSITNPGNKPFAFGAWVAADDWTPSASGMILAQSFSTVDRGPLLFQSSGTSNVHCQTAETSNPSGSVSTTTAPSDNFIDGHYYHFVCAYDGDGGWKMYQDGHLVDTGTSVDSRATTVLNWRVGSQHTGATRFEGRINNAFFYNGVLSDEDIKKLVSSRIDHNANVLEKDQTWKTSYSREDGQTHSAISSGTSLIVDARRNDLYFYGSPLGPGDSVELALESKSISATNVPIQTYDSGFLSAAPATTIPHGLVAIPQKVTLLHETATVGDFREIDSESYCASNVINLVCDWTGLTVSASRRLRVVASASAHAIAVPPASVDFDGLVTTGLQTIGGDKTFYDNVTVSGNVGSGISLNVEQNDSSAITASFNHPGANGHGVRINTETESVNRNLIDARSGDIDPGTSTQKFVVKSNGDTELTVPIDGDCGIGNVCSATASDPSQTAGIGASACDVAAYRVMRVGEVATISFAVSITASVANQRAECNFDPEIVGITGTLSWGSSTQAQGVCVPSSSANGVSARGMFFSETDETIKVRVSNPPDALSNSYRCVGQLETN